MQNQYENNQNQNPNQFVNQSPNLPGNTNQPQSNNMNPNNQYGYQGDPNIPQKNNCAAKGIATILCLFFISPIGLILMWLITCWGKTLKIILTVIIVSLYVYIGLQSYQSRKSAGDFRYSIIDIATENRASTLLYAIDLYETTNSEFPWETTGHKLPSVGNPGMPIVIKTQGKMEFQRWITESKLDKDYLHESYLEDEDVAKLYIWQESAENIMVCYEPVSKSYISDTEYNKYAEKTKKESTFKCQQTKTYGL